jgi:poly(A) polymerase
MDPLQVLREIEASAELGPDAMLRMSAMLPDDAIAGAAAAASVADRLKLSNTDRRRLASLAAPPVTLTPEMSAEEMHVGIYGLGRAAFADLVWLTWSRLGLSASLMPHVEMAASWDIPKFPLGGDDVKDLGVSQGPAVGDLLQEVEAWWIAGDFAADRRACLRELRDLERQAAGTSPAD